MLHQTYKIIRGVYLTANGQEDRIYYFKIPADMAIESGDVCLTFYQNEFVVFPLVAQIRVDAILREKTIVNQALAQERYQHYDYPPILCRVEFDYSGFLNMRKVFQQWVEESTSKGGEKNV